MSTEKRVAALIGALVVVGLTLSLTTAAPPPENSKAAGKSALTVDNTQYVNANKILMFVTNHGNFGRVSGWRVRL